MKARVMDILLTIDNTGQQNLKHCMVDGNHMVNLKE
jgi:hypothetical protein